MKFESFIVLVAILFVGGGIGGYVTTSCPGSPVTPALPDCFPNCIPNNLPEGGDTIVERPKPWGVPHPTPYEYRLPEHFTFKGVFFLVLTAGGYLIGQQVKYAQCSSEGVEE